MRISKKTREQAALICAIAASTDLDPHCQTRPTYDYDVARWLGASRQSDAVVLALDAWTAAFEASNENWTRETDAEAEALLRTGWSPS